MTAPRSMAALTGRVVAAASALAVAWLTCAPSAVAQAGLTPAAASLEYPVKANYLVKFTAFVQWPPDTFAAPASPMTVCILGVDPFGAVLDRAAGAEVINGRRVVVRRLTRIDARSGCQIAYIGKSRDQTVAQALTALADAPVLTVTDSARGTERGVIHFAVSENRVRFHIDERSASRARLSISSRLLSLALSVRAKGSA